MVWHNDLLAGVLNKNPRQYYLQLSDQLPTRLYSEKPAFHLRKVKPSEKEEVLSLLNKFFFRDEPLNKAVKLLESPDSRCKELEEYAISSLHEDVSVGAYDEKGNVVGVVVNGIAKRENANYEDKSSSCPNKKFAIILKVLGHLEREAKIWDKLPSSCHTVLEVRMASTHDAWRGRGLMRVLCEESEKIAKSMKAGALRMDATSAFSAAAAERLGFKKVYSISYKDMKFAPVPPAPHLEARVYIKEI